MFCPHCGSDSDGPLHADCAEDLRKFVRIYEKSTHRYTVLLVERARKLIREYEAWETDQCD